MAATFTNHDLLRFLKQKHTDAGFFDRLKIHYRPLICPFVSLINRVRPGDKVGDIGCGSGQFLMLLSEFSQPSFLYGIEIDPKLIANGRELMPGIDASRLLLEEYDGSHFPPRLGEMDILFLIDVLHHVPPAAQSGFLRNLAAVMKKGATLVIKDIEAANPLVIFNKLHDLVFAGEPGHELKSKDLCNKLTDNGLKISDIQKKTTYVYPHYTVIAKKP